MDRRMLYKSVFWSFFFLFSVIVLSKVRLHEIFGTSMHFSLLAMFGPIIEVFGGFYVSILVLYLARIIQIVIGISHYKSVMSLVTYTPLLFAGHYFARLIKGATKKAAYTNIYLPLIPISAMSLFILHPIGRKVWYFSLYWLIPVGIWLFSSRIDRYLYRFDIPKIYLYALAATFIDHAIGSVMYLYYLDIPAKFWVMALPYVLLERAIFALGILMFYLLIKKASEALRPVVVVTIINMVSQEVQERGILEPVSSTRDTQRGKL